MQRPLLFLSVVLVAFAACAEAPAPPARSGPPVAAAPADAQIDRVERGLLPRVVVKGRPLPASTITERMAALKVPGASVAVIDKGVVAWARGYGVVEAGVTPPTAVTPETLFQAASLSKPVSALGALRLVQEGKLTLDEDANARLRTWRLPPNELMSDDKVTLRRLLSHSAGTTVHGFRGYRAGEKVPTLVQVLDGLPPANSEAIRVDTRPGTGRRYSGGGFTMMQLLMTDLTGKPFPELMRALVLAPLGMDHSTYEQPLPPALASRAAAGHGRDGRVVPGRWHLHPEMAAAGLWTTPSDLGRLLVELAQAKAGLSTRVLGAALTQQMLTAGKGDQGLGVGARGGDKPLMITHGGSNVGYKCVFYAYPDAGQGAVIMTNGDSGSELAQEILRSIAREYGWPDHRPKERAVAAIDTSVYASYAGRYTERRGTVTVTTEPGKLLVQAPPLGPRPVELYPESPGKFFITADDATFTFVTDGDPGKVTELVVHPPGGNQVLRFKRAP
jgi:CubicO group peptidase (beta-lactamase class C family)